MLALVVALLLPGIRWSETSLADFVDGVIDPQMYVSRRALIEPDSGCIEFFSRFDVDNNGFYDLACSDDSGPNLTLYLGSETGYSPSSRLTYPVTSGGNVDLADLNLDGYAELIHSGWRESRCIIYWGTPSGPSRTDTTVLDYGGMGEDVNVYDLDKDSYLDIILGSDNGLLYIFWGSSTGYRTSNRSEVNIGYAIGHNTEIADLNKDGWGDIAIALWTYNRNPIVYWGPNRMPADTVWLPFRWNNCHAMTVADLDMNGWLDLVYTGYDTVVTSLVYFGSSTGFLTGNRTEVHPGQCYGGSAAVDWNYDGWLDIVYLRGNWIDGGRWKPIVYLNTGSPPYFVDGNSIVLGTDTLNASGGFVADLDFNGIRDIFVNNMLPNDSSYILWGPDYLTHTGLPVNNDHHGVFREPGNVYDRSQTAFYLSSVYDAGTGKHATSGSCAWTAYRPPGSNVSVSIRSGPTPVPDSTWTDFAAVDTNGVIPDTVLNERFMQYRLVFRYDRPCYLPYVEEVHCDLVVDPDPADDAAVEAILAPKDTVDSGAVVVPTAVVRNLGNRSSMIPVQFRIGSLYSDDTVIGLDVGEVDTVGFSAWVARPRGTYLVKCTTALVNDTNPLNNALETTVTVRVNDVGPLAIVAPVGPVDSGTVIVPRVVVRNFGTGGAVFPVTLAIGTGYLETVADTLPAGASDTVSFPVWTAAVNGSHAVVTYTSMPSDMRRSNDTLRASVTVLPPEHHDVGVTAILAPVGRVDSGTVHVPRAVVRNFGNQNAMFPVTMRIGTGYNRTVSDTLAPGMTDTVAFPAWTASALESLAVVCYTALAVDENRANDTAKGSVVVTRPLGFDVGTTEILAPVGIVDSGTVHVPRAVVKNFGTQGAAFPVTMRIGSSYAETVGDTLAPGMSDTVSFPAWTANELESLDLVCYTALVGDEYPANDTTKGVVFVARPEHLDVGTTEILAPLGTVDSGTVHIPSAVVENFGNQTAVFPVAMRIGTGYLRMVVDTLAPGRSDTVSFPVWTASRLESLEVVCYTALVGDENRTNDTAKGMVYVIQPRDRDVGPVEILAPAGAVDSGTVHVPRVVVRNYGSVTAAFPVSLTIGTDYSQTVADTVEAGGFDTLEFPTWTASKVDSLGIECITLLAGDERPENDTVRGLVVVLRPRLLDVGVAAIIEPAGNVEHGLTYVPRALVRNYGLMGAVFPVTMNIGNGYSATVVESLAAHETDTVAFRNWVAYPAGIFQTVCFTDLAGDEYRANDTATGSVTVSPPPVHDIGCVEILAPTDGVRDGDVVVPRARIRNFGTIAERFYSVRFKIGADYYEIVRVDWQLAPGATVDVDFPVWLAAVGSYSVACSTRLESDVNPGNDELERDLDVLLPFSLAVEPSQSDKIQSGETRSYYFYVELLGDVDSAVVLCPVETPSGWQTALCDSTNASPITELRPVYPGRKTYFTLRVSAPSLSLERVLDTAVVSRFVVKAFMVGDTLVSDTAGLTLGLVPNLEIHNFPNPMENQTKFVIGMPDPGRVSLTVYNRAGERVCRVLESAPMEAGIHFVEWNGTNDHDERVAIGTYQCLLEYEHQGRTDWVVKKLIVRRGGK